MTKSHLVDMLLFEIPFECLGSVFLEFYCYSTRIKEHAILLMFGACSQYTVSYIPISSAQGSVLNEMKCYFSSFWFSFIVIVTLVSWCMKKVGAIKQMFIVQLFISILFKTVYYEI